MSSTPTQINRLADATSPYLRQHADNPVHWQPWDETALAAARDEGKLILLSIGYSACHWCHVMAHESFEDAQIAAQMNRDFINIKVDREERPDLDRIYQTAHQLLTGRGGGWPLTVFLTPDQLPFFAGTYFPRKGRQGMPGFDAVMERVVEVYRDRPEEIHEQNADMQQVSSGWPLYPARPNCPAARRWRMPDCSSASGLTRPLADLAAHLSFRSRSPSTGCCGITPAASDREMPIAAHCTWPVTPCAGWRWAGSTIRSGAALPATRWMASG